MHTTSNTTLQKEGIVLSKGFGHGPIHIHVRHHFSRSTYVSTKNEKQRFINACKKMQKELNQLCYTQTQNDNQEILEAFSMIAADQVWQDKVLSLIAQNKTAIDATQKVFWDLEKQFRRSSNQMLAERVPDLQDILGRLIAYLTHQKTIPIQEQKKPFILAAHFLGPGELMGYTKYPLQGLILEEGLSTSHISMLAKNMKIPMITGIKNLLTGIKSGDMALLDGYAGHLFIHPSKSIFKDYLKRKRNFLAQEKESAETLRAPPITKDGLRISLNINAGLPEDLQIIDDIPIDGVGLYRTEISFMLQPRWPTVDEQTALYRAVLQKAKDHPVTFRTLDIGADKMLPYMQHAPEHNPMMGMRAIRVSLNRPTFLRQQIRSILRACEKKIARILLPMVAELAEFLAVREFLDSEISRAKRQKQCLPKKIELGVMLEIPALAWQLSSLLPQVDFVSIGSNDLFQFFFASDRNNVDVGSRYDVLSPAFLKFIQYIVTECEKHQIPVAVCGEMAGQPLEAMALIGLGVTRLSMSTSSVNQVKLMVRQLVFSKLENILKHLLQTSRRSIRQDLLAFGREHDMSVFV